MPFLLSIFLFFSYCFTSAILVKANPNSLDAPNIWIDSPTPMPIDNSPSLPFSTQPLGIIIAITVSLTLVVAIMLFNIFSSNSKKKSASNLSKQNQSNFQILDHCLLENNQNLYLVQLAERQFLLASTLTSVCLISEINSENNKQAKLNNSNNLDFMTIATAEDESLKTNAFTSLLKTKKELEEQEESHNISLAKENLNNQINRQSIFKKNQSDNPQLIQVSPIQEANSISHSALESANHFEEAQINNTAFSSETNRMIKKPTWLQNKQMNEASLQGKRLKENLESERGFKAWNNTETSESNSVLASTGQFSANKLNNNSENLEADRELNTKQFAEVSTTKVRKISIVEDEF